MKSGTTLPKFRNVLRAIRIEWMVTSSSHLRIESMQPLLEKKIEFVSPSKSMGLANWALTEIPQKGRYREYVVWDWALHFVATSCEIVRRSSVTSKFYGDDTETRRPSVSSTWDVVLFTLGPARCHEDPSSTYETQLSMFGTDRPITKVYLELRMLRTGDHGETCEVAGSPAFESDNEIIPDILTFVYSMRKERFFEIADKIESGRVSEVRFRAALIDGAYAEWAPDHYASLIKILTLTPEHEIEQGIGSAVDIPSTVSVGDAEITVLTTFDFSTPAKC